MSQWPVSVLVYLVEQVKLIFNWALTYSWHGKPKEKIQKTNGKPILNIF